MSLRCRMVCAWMGLGAFFSSPAAAFAVEYTGKNYPDPFADLSSPVKNEETAVDAKQKTLSSLAVQGVVLSSEGNMAIINGRVARQGEVVQGFRIRSIEADGVWVGWAAEPDSKPYKLLHKRGNDA